MPCKINRGSMVNILYKGGALLAALFLVALLLGASTLVQASDTQEKVLFLVEDAGRLIASNTLFSRFDELRISAKEQIVRQEVAEAVAVVVTNQRLIAYGAYAPGWKSERLLANERVVSIEAEDSSVLVVTTDRLLNFYGKRGSWAISKRSVEP